MSRRLGYELFTEGDELYSVGHVVSRQYPGVAMRALGWETQPDEDTTWSGIEERMGRVVCVMVGDDLHRSFDPDDLQHLARSAFCSECGQVGCHCDGYEEEEGANAQ
jgi:hypothetical protein